jgi:hypothetical protein
LRSTSYVITEVPLPFYATLWQLDLRVHYLYQLAAHISPVLSKQP